MTSVENFTFEYHRDRCAELFEMASVVLADESMPRKERVMELDRLLKRLAGHEAAMQISTESYPPFSGA